MTATRIVKWTAKNGKEIEVNIEITKDVQDDIRTLDGDEINLGRKTVDRISITITADGKHLTRDSHKPEILEEKFYRHRWEQLQAAGAYARVGDAYIGKEQYNMIMDAIAEIESELTESPEYTEVKAQEEANEAREMEAAKKEAEIYAQQIKNGLCPKCESYCYGDCEAN